MAKKTRSQTVNNHIRLKYDRISCLLPRGTKEKLKHYARANKTSANKLLGDYVAKLLTAKPEVPESFTRALDSIRSSEKKADEQS